jgi:hypothetical protein
MSRKNNKQKGQTAQHKSVPAAPTVENNGPAQTGQPQGAHMAHQEPPSATPPSAEFAWKVHGYTNEYIRFADAKAGAIITWCAGLIALLFTIKAQTKFLPPQITVADIDWKATGLAAAAITAFLFLTLSVTFGFLTILPRLWVGDAQPEPFTWQFWFWPWRLIRATYRFFAAFMPRTAGPPGLIYWESVRAHLMPAAYSAAVIGCTAEQLTQAVAQHVFVLGGISKKKYYYVDCCIRLAFIGSAAALIVALFG